MAVAKYDSSDGRLRGRKAQARRLRLWSVDPHCVKCGRLTNYPDGFNLDHIVPLFKGGPDEDGNLQVLCVPCHDVKTMKDMGFVERVTVGLDGWPIVQ